MFIIGPPGPHGPPGVRGLDGRKGDRVSWNGKNKWKKMEWIAICKPIDISSSVHIKH